MKEFSLTDLHMKTNEVLREANKAPVVIKSYRRHAYVITSIEDVDKSIWALNDCVDKLLGKNDV